MLTVNIGEAKARFSELVARAARGESFVIAKAGKPMVKVVPFEEVPAGKLPRIGFMEGMFSVPDDFDTMFREEIEAMFYDGPLFPDEDQDKAGDLAAG